MWSVASQWQIYFVFLFFLLPLWRRFGIAFSTIAGVLLGVFSYSLYLVHAPLLALAHFSTRAFTPTLLLKYAIMLGVAAPLSIVVSYGFHLAFERRFMSAHSPRTEKETVTAAIASPAP